MGAPQIIYLALTGVTMLLAANVHGKAKTGKYNFWNYFINTIIAISLLYWGGFFK